MTTHDWRKLRQLSAPQWRCLLWAMCMLPVVDGVLRLRGFAAAQRWAEVPLGTAGVGIDVCQQAAMWGRMINIAAARGPYSTSCLRRSLVLLRYMRQRGVDGALKIGAPTAAAACSVFEAHAWVEVDNLAINEAPDITSRFVAFNLPASD